MVSKETVGILIINREKKIAALAAPNIRVKQ
jgi:hypothetical protein